MVSPSQRLLHTQDTTNTTAESPNTKRDANPRYQQSSCLRPHGHRDWRLIRQLKRTVFTFTLNVSAKWRKVVRFTPLPLNPWETPPPPGPPGGRGGPRAPALGKPPPPPVPTGGWVSPTSGLNVLENRRILCSFRNSNPESSSS